MRVIKVLKYVDGNDEDGSASIISFLTITVRWQHDNFNNCHDASRLIALQKFMEMGSK